MQPKIGVGVAILPEETIRGEVANQALAAVRLEGDYSRPLAVLYKKGKVLKQRARVHRPSWKSVGDQKRRIAPLPSD